MDSIAEATKHTDHVALTALIVGAYVSHNPISSGDLPRLIADVHAALSGLGNAESTAVPEQPAPAVPAKRSVRPEAITCLDCGKTFKSLKRHLMANHGLTPDAYRGRWRLSRDYPMVAPLYAEVRAKLAKGVGLGRRKPVAKGRQRRR